MFVLALRALKQPPFYHNLNTRVQAPLSYNQSKASM